MTSLESAGKCQALFISDERKCTEPATSTNGLFCALHSKQCQGLYRGYKIRNAKLDALERNPPKYLKENKASISAEKFEKLSSKEDAEAVHKWLFQRLQLLDRVIRARALHHSRFFSQQMDYGHNKFLDVLRGQRASTIAAMERLQKRTAEILYKETAWYTWVKQCQNEEEEKGKKEKEKVKLEAAMFKRHWKNMEARMKDMRKKEDAKRDEAYLDSVYQERMKERESSAAETDDEADWDPIEDVLDDSRESYVELIQSFLWMAVQDESENSQVEHEITNAAGSSMDNEAKADALAETSASATNAPASTPAKASGSKKGKGKSKKNVKNAGKKDQAPTKPQDETVAEPDKKLVESREQTHHRLRNGVDFISDNVAGLMIGGTKDEPILITKTQSYPEAEAQRLLGEVEEIKHLLFCRLLLRHRTLLPAALKAGNIQEFLADKEVTPGALRDLCLEMENPGLQTIRDACADLFRTDEEADEAEKPVPKPEVKKKLDHIDKMFMKAKKRRGELPDTWKPKSEMVKQATEMGIIPTLESVIGGGGDGGAIRFGEIKEAENKKIRVKVCGRYIWNYPSDKAMNRGGWLHFCILAKDSSLYDAVALCRHWDEFMELNLLALWHYFPGARWCDWVANHFREQMLRMGFIMYFESSSPDAEQLTMRTQQGGRGRGPRSHAQFQARNFICAHIKRDDAASQRLLQYLSMQGGKLLMLVRDAESGKLLIKPDEDQLWLFREKSGLGRASKNEWNVLKSVGPVFFEEMNTYRKWHFSFKEYYDVYVWDQEAGEPFAVLYNNVYEMLVKALRIRKPSDLFNPAESVLRTICRDDDAADGSRRPRDIKPGENVKSMWDEIHEDGTQFFFGKLDGLFGNKVHRPLKDAGKFPPGFFYNTADRLEDEILFPQDQNTVGELDPVSAWIEDECSMRKFIEGWESDYSLFSDEEELDLDEDEDEDEDETDEADDEDEALQDSQGDDDDEWEDEEEVPQPEREANTRAIMWEIADTVFSAANGYSEEYRAAKKNLILDKERSSNFTKKTIKSDREQVSEDFELHIDKERSRVFKQVWHMADLEPNAQSHYITMKEIVRQARKFNHREKNVPQNIVVMQLMLELKIHNGGTDVHNAAAKLTPYFCPQFFDTKYGAQFKDSLLFNQEERAKNFPDIRTFTSNKYRPKEFFDQFEKLFIDEGMYLDTLPAIHDETIRPIVARLYKAGAIRTRADAYHEGQAFMMTEPHRPDKPELFIDWRTNINTIRMPPNLIDPYSITALKITAAAFAAKNPSARFSVLTLWSSPHFYPLMIGADNREPTSFRDIAGRCFNWMFVPKDMPCSEFSIHHTARLRIEPYMKFFGDRVVLKRDKFLVCAKDERELLRLSMAVVFAVECRPWMREVDLWKSWVNVDARFLEGLDDKWLD